MSSNDSILRDEDGSSPDWIELYNSGASEADLTGLHLTDNVNNRTKWELPGGSLQPGESIVVFASGKDRAVVGSPFHTNFKLASDGEYVGLYDVDGRTVISDYASLPGQFTDISYGVSQNLTSRTLITAGGDAKVLLPTAGNDVAAASWTGVEFDDATWAGHKTAVGFDADASDGDFSSVIHADGGLTTMQGSTPSAYVRQTFDLPDADSFPQYKDLSIDVNYDDGFVAYLNGEQILSVNAPETLAWNSTATETHGGIADVIDYQDFGGAQGDFTVLGDAAWGGDIIQLTPSAANQNGAVWRSSPVKFGSDYTFEASMVFDIHTPGGPFIDGDGIGAEGMTFVLQANDNNVIGQGGASLGLEGTGMTFLAIELDSNAAGVFDEGETLASHIGVDTNDGSLGRTAISRFNGDAFFPGEPGPGSNFSYVWVNYAGETKMLDVYYATSDQKPAEPTLSVEVDLNELFSDTPELFAGWTATTSGSYNGHDVRSFDMITGVGELGREAESFDIAAHVDKLRPGKNVLAVHGLNINAGDEDFLLSTTLSVNEVVLGDRNFFATPTPGELNGQATLAPGGAVTISEPTKVFTEPFTVSISAEHANAVIRYTTDGTLPTEESPVYTAPMTITAQTRLRARAFEPDKSPGPVSTSGFIKVAAELVNFENTGKPFESNLPVIIVDSFQSRRINSDTRRMTPSSAVFLEVGEDGTTGLFDTPELTTRVGMRIRGQTSEGFAKKQYAVEFIGDGVDDTERYVAAELDDVAHSVFGFPEESDWVLNGPYSDKSQLNNYLTFNWYNKIGTYAPRTRLVELFVNTDEELNMADSYRGTYVMLEKIKVDSNRVDITPQDPGNNSGNAITGGYVWKKDKTGAEDLNIRTGVQNQEVRIIEPSCSDVGRNSETRKATCTTGEISDQQIEWLTDYLTEFEGALYGDDFMDPVNGYAKYVDVDSWVDTWLMVEFTKNIDGFRLSTYYYKDRGGKIKQGPAWDYNLSLGNGNYLQGAFPNGWYSSGIGGADYPYWDRLFEDPAFSQKVSERWAELRKGPLSEENVLADIEAAVGLLSNNNPNLDHPAPGEPSNPVSRNFARWTTRSYSTDTYAWPNCFFGQGACPRSPLPNGRSPETYGDFVDIMKWFVVERGIWMDSQLVPPITATPPAGVVKPSTKVTLEGPEGYELFYTLNGSDPEEPLLIKGQHTLIGENAAGRIAVPTSSAMIDACEGFNVPDPTKCFIGPDYVLGSHGETWTDVTLGVGYDDGTDFDSLITTDLAGQLKGNASSYLMVEFDLPEALESIATGISLDVRYDGGFAMYSWRESLNAPVEIVRANIEGTGRRFPIRPLTFDQTSEADRPDADAMAFETIDASVLLQYLNPGKNTVVFQLANDAAGSDDYLFDFRLNLETTQEEISPFVLRYDGPITVTENTTIFAKGFDADSNDWTNGIVASYVTDVPDLAITELHYNPLPPTAEELAAVPGASPDDFEFVEVLNTTGREVNLFGLKFTDGVDFTFGDVSLADGERGVVVSNAAAFAARYGSDIKVLGDYNGVLSNGGEQITLADTSENPIVSFSYSDNRLWPAAADGVGASLTIKDAINTPVSLYGKSYNWMASQEFGGSPGTAGLAPTGVVINEILSRTDADGNDAVELLNMSGATVDVSGWYLSDSSDNFLKYQIPAGTSIPAAGTLVIDATAFNADPNAENSFGLSGTDGDDLYVTIAVDGKALILVAEAHFDASLEGESWSRYPNGYGRLAPTPVSLGEPNTRYPRVGPVVISEVNYNPGAPTAAALAIDPDISSADLEFIEIYNSATETVQTTDWRVNGGARYNFDLNSSLPAGSTSLLISFNPLDATRLAAFKAHYGIGDEVNILGNYTGQLDGDEDRITLYGRDLSLADQPVVLPLITQDEVYYDSSGLWPTEADGTGMTLQRVAVDQYGNLATSWMAGEATPGATSFVGGMPGDLNGDRVVDAADIDRMCTEVHAATPAAAFDLNGDGSVDQADYKYLIRDILRTTPGDANLDGAFDSRDLVQVFQGGQYEDNVTGNGSWANGNWNCDGEFTTRDFVAAFMVGEYIREATAVDRTIDNSQIAGALNTTEDVENLGSPAGHDVITLEQNRRPVVIELNDATWSIADSRDRLFAQAAEADELDDDLLKAIL
ncbi:MAG: lamin tail domain-containing protein [Planctomycetales bacterium]|nr:lamin tail domain-containing protein [Planctomycetales bacterium]